MAIAFKEWALVCAALGSGRQSLIIRKGGIHEGRDGFRFAHREFLLFPTLFHEQRDKLKPEAWADLPHERTEISIAFHATVEWTEFVTDAARLPALDPFHVWTPETIAQRFDCEETRGVHVAFVRVERLDTPLSFTDSPKYGGCRSWVEVPDPSAQFISVLSDTEHRQREGEIAHALGKPTTA